MRAVLSKETNRALELAACNTRPTHSRINSVINKLIHFLKEFLTFELSRRLTNNLGSWRWKKLLSSSRFFFQLPINT